MNALEKGTIASVFVVEALEEAARRGIDTATLLHEAGIATYVFEAPRARVTPRMYGTLWQRLADRLNDEFFGIDSHGMKRGSYILLCHCVLHAETLGQALTRALHFLNVVLSDFQATLTQNGERAEIRLVDRSVSQRLFSSGAYLLIVHGLGSWLAKRRIPILGTRFRAIKPPEFHEYQTLFGPVVEYGCEDIALAFDASLLQLRIRQTPATLKQFLRDAPASFLLKYRDTQSAAARVRRLIQRIPPADWPPFDTLAAMMLVSPSTLRRRLEDEGQPYQLIKDELRRDLAVHLLQTSRASVADVALQVGFNEASAFHRAFRKWTGLAPGQFRDGTRRGTVG